MDRTTIRDYLTLTAMNEAQAEALSNVFAEMATKHDLAELDARLTGRMDELTAQMAGLDARLTGQMAELDARLTGRMAELDARLTGRMAEFESRLTWRMIAVVGFFATASAMFNVYAG